MPEPQLYLIESTKTEHVNFRGHNLQTWFVRSAFKTKLVKDHLKKKNHMAFLKPSTVTNIKQYSVQD